MKLLALILGAAMFGCGGDEPSEEMAVDLGPDTLPASIEAPEVEGGFLIVSPEQVRSWQEAREPFVLVDARDPVQFRREHIAGAVNVPYSDIRAGGNLPPRDARIVVYCSDRECPISQYAYEILRTLGYVDLYDMREGIQGWKAAGYPTVIDETEALDVETPDTTAQA